MKISWEKLSLKIGLEYTGETKSGIDPGFEVIFLIKSTFHTMNNT